MLQGEQFTIVLNAYAYLLHLMTWKGWTGHTENIPININTICRYTQSKQNKDTKSL